MLADSSLELNVLFIPISSGLRYSNEGAGRPCKVIGTCYEALVF